MRQLFQADHGLLEGSPGLIPANRFIVQSRHRDEWLAARREGVTATEVASAATESGFLQAQLARVTTDEVFPNDYMRFGTDAEHDIMRHARDFGILENDWLIAAINPHHLATPDGLSPDHQLIAEAKTTGADWVTPPIKYRRQIQFQLYVTGAERCLLLWNLRVPDDMGGFYLGWIEPKTLWVERDPKTITELTAIADRLLED